MKRFLLLFLATVVTAWSASAQLSVSQLRTEHLTDPVGIGERRPLLSWEVSDASRRGVTQSAYEIRVKSGGRTVWRTGKVASAESAGVFYDGTPLTNPEVAVTGDGFVAGEVSDIKATGSVT